MDSSKPFQHQLVAGWRGWDGAVTHLPSSGERYPQPDIRTTDILRFANTLFLSGSFLEQKGLKPYIFNS